MSIAVRAYRWLSAAQDWVIGTGYHACADIDLWRGSVCGHPAGKVRLWEHEDGLQPISIRRDPGASRAQVASLRSRALPASRLAPDCRSDLDPHRT